MATTMYRLILVLNFGFLLIRYVYATDEEYIIHPLERLPPSQRIDLGNDIKKSAQDGSFYTSYRLLSDQPLLPRFWTAVLSHRAYSLLEKDDRVSDIRQNSNFISQQGSETGGHDNTRDHLSDAGRSENLSLTTAPTNASKSYFPMQESITYTTQRTPAATELRVLSQPKNEGPIGRYKNYVYRKDKIQETYIYHVEFGINGTHVDFVGRVTEWVILPGADGRREESPVGIPGHSTCTASKAIGRIYGASRKAKLVVVKMRGLTIRDMEEALDNTRDHILSQGRAGTSVVSISWVSPRITDRDDYINNKMIEILRSYYDSGIYIVCCAGNYAMELDETSRPRTWVDTLPAYYSVIAPLRLRVRFPIVVSNCDNDGILFRESQQARWDRLSAPGVNIMCAAADTVTGIHFSTGTSFSAPLVAGVLADFLASGQIPNTDIGDLNEFLVREASWPRRYFSPSTIWNMIDIEHNKPAFTYANASFFNVNASFFETTSSDNAQFDVTSE